MKIETQEQLDALFRKTNFFQSGPHPIEWDYIKFDDCDGEPYIYIGEAASLGISTIQKANDCENSNWDHFFIGELARLFAEGRLTVKQPDQQPVSNP